MKTDPTVCKRSRTVTDRRIVEFTATMLLLAGLCLACEDPSGPVPPDFEVIDLGAYAHCGDTRTGCRSDAYDVNDAGQVIGIFPSSTDWDIHSFVWQSGSVLEIGGWGAAFAINNLGQVVGNNGLWDDGEWSDIGELRGVAINDLGEIAGTAVYLVGETEWGDPFYETHATLLRGDVLTDLGTLGGISSFASALNESGQVVGWSATAVGGPELGERVHAFFWEDGVMTDLGGLGGDFSYALDINNSGQVVGWFGSGNEWNLTNARGFLWEDGEVTVLETLGGDPTHAFGINEAGDIVGGSTTAAGAYHAVLWRDGGLVDLGTLDGYGVSQAYEINESGTIVGYSEAPRERRATMWRRR